MYVVLYKGLRRATWRSRLVGRGRATGNRVIGNTIREFESLLLRQNKNHPFGWFLFCNGRFELSREGTFESAAGGGKSEQK